MELRMQAASFERVKDFLAEILTFGGKYSYVNGTSIVVDARNLLKEVEHDGALLANELSITDDFTTVGMHYEYIGVYGAEDGDDLLPILIPNGYKIVKE
jgi:hypothetical protein